MKRRTIQDKLVCGFNTVKYLLTEPAMLRCQRLRYENTYQNNNSKPLVSVYIPTYNRADILMERAVPSVLAQTYKNFELIIVGDCCTDSTAEKVANIKDKRIRFFNLPARKYRYPPSAENHWLAGPVVASNLGLKLVRGKWIARIDDDDVWVPEHLEKMLQLAYAGNYEFVSAQFIEERFGIRKLHFDYRARDEYYTRRPNAVKGYNPKIGGTSTWVYRSYLRFFKYNIDCWRKSWNRVNDIDISLRMFYAGVRMGFYEGITAYVLPRPGEETIGIDAYVSKEKEKVEHYKFSS